MQRTEIDGLWVRHSKLETQVRLSTKKQDASLKQATKESKGKKLYLIIE